VRPRLISRANDFRTTPGSPYARCARLSAKPENQLRRVLADYFDPVVAATAIRCARLAGQIPEGHSGYGGSAPVTIRQALLIPLALASEAHPKEAPAAAERIGAFRLLRRDETHASEPAKRMPYENQTITLLDALASEVERFDPPDRLPSSWHISDGGACQIAPDRLLFGPNHEDVLDPAECVIRSCRLPARLLVDIAELFHAERAEAAD
jgi:hypothetical protein